MPASALPILAEILSIGDELLNGLTLNANARYLAGVLTEAGLLVHRQTTVPDDREAIRHALERARTESRVIVCTGGLGGTSDDVTRPTLSDFFDSPLTAHAETVAQIRNFFNQRQMTLRPEHLLPAEIPACATPLLNTRGLAPGMRFELPQTGLLFVLPGIPHEVRLLTETYILPELTDRYQTDHYRVQTFRMMGLTESELAHRMQGLEASLPEEIRAAYNPSPEAMEFRLTLRCPRAEADRLDLSLNQAAQQARQELASYIFSEHRGEMLEEVLGKQLLEAGLTIAVAESCTGGRLSAQLTSIPGASRYVLGSCVAYANALKMSMLEVKQDTLQTHGAVSEQTALEMAEGIRRHSGSDVALSTTGIAGPGGGTASKPVGLVWIGYADGHTSLARRFDFGGFPREVVVRRTIAHALYLALRQLRTTESRLSSASDHSISTFTEK